jgi:hypothetical protein
MKIETIRLKNFKMFQDAEDNDAATRKRIPIPRAGRDPSETSWDFKRHPLV